MNYITDFNPKTCLANFLTQDPTMLKVKKKVRALINLPGSILISGPTGTGKELLAKALHAKKNGKFVPVNCGAYPEHLADSILFGHAKGAFTGAYNNTVGQVAAAYDGTLFLDEIATLPNHIQIKLLRVLNDGCFYMVGDSTPQHTNARIIAATNENLSALVKQGKFREDLYARIVQYELQTTPVSARPSDMLLYFDTIYPRLIQQLVEIRTSEGMSCSVDSIREEIISKDWPGNYRSLRSFAQNIELDYFLMTTPEES